MIDIVLTLIAVAILIYIIADSIKNKLPESKINLSNEYPNGKESFLETYYEIVAEITQSVNLGDLSKRVTEVYAKEGRLGLYSLAYYLTIEFERQYAPTWFEIYDFYETIDAFLKKELYEKN